jgi:hypothetical protein
MARARRHQVRYAVHPPVVDDCRIRPANEQKVGLHRIAARHEHADRRRHEVGEILVLGRDADEVDEVLDDPLVEEAGRGGHIQHPLDHLIAIAVVGIASQRA